MEQQTESWLEWRNNGIGSSDVPIILGVSPYKTSHQLFMEKSGQIKPEDLTNSFVVQRGIRLEPSVRARVELMTGLEFKPYLVEHPEYKFMRASLDGYNAETDTIVEIKVIGKVDFEANKVPDKYYPQIQHQLFVTKAKKAIYAGYYIKHKEPEDSGKLIMIDVFPDEEFFKSYFIKCAEFWEAVNNTVKASHEIKVENI